ncbi:MAG: proprotein convertase P-domain-containing protein, partial [Planctomycetaceae bacterium]|nr:proprotein convertase P-domain-containing protein [Planctomycetaceae bacterium]
MTVLRSLLSTLRRRHSATRRSRRGEAVRHSSAETLEARLLLTNPISRDSLPGAASSIYLDFDGYTEADAEWTVQRRSGNGPIMTPEFDLDGNPGAFNATETLWVEEIWARVAEDFRPFNINVTTNEPSVIRNSEDVFVSIGGDGAWSVAAGETPDRYEAIFGSFTAANQPNSVFVFQSAHSGLGGDFQVNISSSISQAVAGSMGLQLHRNSDGTLLEGDNAVAPILGDGIVGPDTVSSNPNSLRDIWVRAPGNTAAIQDDLAVLVGNVGVSYRQDDYGDDDGSAFGITVTPQQEVVTGVIEQNSDVDVFSFATEATTATIRVSGLDLTTSPFLGATPGGNLDPTIVLRDVNGVEIDRASGSANPGLAVTLQNVQLQAGAYYIEISNNGDYGNLGQYTVTIDGVDRLPARINPVALNSNSGAPVTLYLGFAGDDMPATHPLLLSRVDNGSGGLTLEAFDTDGDPTNFTQTEVDQITEIWARVAEDFRPFDVNVTTVLPGAFADGVAMQVSIGDSAAFLDPAVVDLDYASLFGAFTDPAAPNSGYVFSEDIIAGAITDGQRVADQASAAAARMLGLGPHPLYSISGTVLRPFHPGSFQSGPILGDPITSLRSIWVNADGASGPGILQDDLAEITNPATNRITFRQDAVGDTVATATPILLGPGDENVYGIIETNNDVDVYRIDTLATTLSVSVKGLDLTADYPSLTNPGSNLDPVLELLDAGGNRLAISDSPFIAGQKSSLTAAINNRPVSAGTYYIRISNRGEYGNLGEYTVTLAGADVNPVTITLSPDTFSEIDGLQTAVGTVRRPAGQSFGPAIVVDLVSTDTSEVTVPAQVTIPPSAAFVNFDITLQDDNLLDGNQRVGIQAAVGGVTHGEAFVTVTDYESVSLSLNPDPVAENAGSAQLTVSRSNTDVGEPNHWVVSNNNLIEYDPSGTMVSAAPIAVPWPTAANRPAGQTVHDITTLQDGRVAVYNGLTNAYLSIYNPVADSWSHIGPISGLSAAGADQSTGGISAVGDYVFLSDLESFDGDEHGLVRVNVKTGAVDRFAGRTLGARIFAMANPPRNPGRLVYELDPSTGELLNTITLERPADALTFDGTYLWAVFRADFFTVFEDQLYKIDPNTGDVLEIHPLGVLQNSQFEGLTYLDGVMYLVDNDGDNTFSLTIEGYDPVNRRGTGSIIAFELVNSTLGLEGGSFVGALPSAHRLLITSSFSNEVWQVDPLGGGITSTFVASQPYPFDFSSFGTGPGITSVSDVVIGGVTYNDLIYIHSAPNEFDVYTSTGQVIDADPTTPNIIDPVRLGIAFSGDISGNDVPGISASEPKFREVAVGLDGLVYGLLEAGNEILVFDPDSLAAKGTILLDTNVTSIAVVDGGVIYGGTATGEIRQFDGTGATVSTAPSPIGFVSDLEVNVGGDILASGGAGMVISATRDEVASGDLSGARLLEDVGNLAFTAFGRSQFRPSGNLVVSLTSSDLTGIQVPDTVTIPVGQQSITIPVTIIDDNIRDGDQTVTLTATATEYVPASTDVIVSDYEVAGVDVVPATVAENAGVLADGVHVFRSDVDGPYTHNDRITRTFAGPLAIVDNDVTAAQIIIPHQVSQITDVNVTLNIQHAALPDLDVYLISPSGTRIELFTDLSSNASNLTNTILDDQAATSIISGAAPFTGRFLPEQFLAELNGENPSGTWTLEVIDDSRLDTGTLLNWSIEISTIGLAELPVTLISSDTGEAVVQTTVVIPANQSEVFIPLDVIDDAELDGTQTVTVSAATTTSGFIPGADNVDVTDAELLTITVDRTTVSEGAGTGVIVATVTRSDTGTAAPLVINLFSSDDTELAVPASVTMAADRNSVTFTLDAVDDLLFDGDQVVNVSAVAPGYVTAVSEDITVTDQEPRLVLSTLTPSVPEDQGTIIITVSRVDASDLTVAQQITLSSSDLTELTVPATFLIPQGAVSTSFTATILEDTLLDGPQIVTITAADANTASPVVNSGTLKVTVEDAEFLRITVPAGSEQILENAGANAVQATVSVSSVGHTTPIVVMLASSDLSEASVPAQVIIPVGQNSATFPIAAVNDDLIDRLQMVDISASATGYRTGHLNLGVADHEPPVLAGPTRDTEDPTPSLVWQPVEGATRYDLWLNDVSRNIVQFFRMDNIPAPAPLFRDDFQSGALSSALWLADGVEVNGNAVGGAVGNQSVHFDNVDPNPTGSDILQSATLDLSSEAGAQLRFLYQHDAANADPLIPPQSLVLSYRGADNQWNVLQTLTVAGSTANEFHRLAVNLPAAAMHSSFGFRLEISGPDNSAGNWYIDDVEIAPFPKIIPTQQIGVGIYRYWVRAYDDLEQPGFWSNGIDFRVRTRPEIISPADNSTASSSEFPEISWTTVVDTDRYELWVNNETTGESQVIHETNLQTTSFASLTANLPGGTYKAWARAFSPDDLPGFWSYPVTFTVLQAPTNLSPTGATFDRTPTIGWDAVEGAASYDVWVSRRTAGEVPALVLRDQFVTGTTYTPRTDLPDGQYVVWVRAVSQEGSESAWSAGAEFTIGGRPRFLSPATGSTSTSRTPPFLWSGITGADVYEFWVNEINPTTQTVIRSKVVYAGSVSVTSFTTSTLTPG